MLKAENAALVVVDVQGKLATLMHEKESFFAAVGKMIQGVQLLDIPVLWNEQLPDKLGDTIPELKEILGETKPLIKSSFSCCGNPDFMSALKAAGRKQVLLVGMETHVCVYQTAMDLMRAGYEVYLIADAVSSRTLENKRIGIDAMVNAGALIASVEMVIFEMLVEAKGDKFRQAIKIVK